MAALSLLGWLLFASVLTHNAAPDGTPLLLAGVLCTAVAVFTGVDVWLREALVLEDEQGGTAPPEGPMETPGAPVEAAALDTATPADAELSSMGAAEDRQPQVATAADAGSSWASDELSSPKAPRSPLS